MTTHIQHGPHHKLLRTHYTADQLRTKARKLGFKFSHEEGRYGLAALTRMGLTPTVSLKYGKGQRHFVTKVAARAFLDSLKNEASPKAAAPQDRQLSLNLTPPEEKVLKTLVPAHVQAFHERLALEGVAEQVLAEVRETNMLLRQLLEVWK